MNVSLKNNVAIVTGASRGIGRAIAIALAKEGCKTVLVGRNKRKLQETQKGVEKYSDAIISIGDVSNAHTAKEVVAGALKKFGRVDTLVNNAGFGIYKDFEDCSLEEIESLIKTNFLGTVYFIKAVLPVMKKQKSGSIINIASLAGMAGTPSHAGYAASKFAVLGLSESLYFEFKPDIFIGVICPGPIDTEFFMNKGYEIRNFPVKKISPEKVAVETVISLKRKRFFVAVPKWQGHILALKSVLPGMYRKGIEKVAKRF
ncbi:SDR family NAD(P)-dependent oxidoreductase [Candidatus Woesearchaeota archaeon]|nr:MAG: SDR family NAD(P)-dependent oxidoreductase [Candidatus Woesearchaeota archaeon]